MAELPIGVGSEQYGKRPVLVVQCEAGNLFSGTTVIVPASTSLTKKRIPTHVNYTAGDEKLKASTIFLCEQIRVIDKSRLESKLLTHLDKKKMAEINRAISIGLELEGMAWCRKG
jgi:mRNA interferase MazF